MDRVLCPEVAIAIFSGTPRHSGSSRRFGGSRESALRRNHRTVPLNFWTAWFSLLTIHFFREFGRFRGFVSNGKSEYHQRDPLLGELLLSAIAIVMNRLP